MTLRLDLSDGFALVVGFLVVLTLLTRRQRPQPPRSDKREPNVTTFDEERAVTLPPVPQQKRA